VLDGSISWGGRGAASNRIMKISASIVTTFLQADPIVLLVFIAWV
jgi:hypothetical protein